MKLEMGSARNTPVTPNPPTWGSRRVRGTTMMILRRMEKKMACRDRPSPTNTDWAEICRAIMKKPKKYRCMAGAPASRRAGLLLNTDMSCRGKRNTTSHASSM